MVRMNSPNAQAAHSFTGLTIAVKRGEWWIWEAPCTSVFHVQQMLDLLTVFQKDRIFIFCSWWMSQATSFPGADRILFKNDQSTTVHQNFTGIWCYKVQFGVIFGLFFFPVVAVPSDVFSVCLLCEYLCMCSHMCNKDVKDVKKAALTFRGFSTYFFFTAMVSLSVHNTLPWISENSNLMQQGNILHSKRSWLANFSWKKSCRKYWY